MKQHTRIRFPPITPMENIFYSNRKPDVEALQDVRPPDKRKYYGLRHKPSGLWFATEGKSAKRYYVSPDPFLRPKSACTMWLQAMEKPEDWEVVQLEVKIVVMAEGKFTY